MNPKTYNYTIRKGKEAVGTMTVYQQDEWRYDGSATFNPPHVSREIDRFLGERSLSILEDNFAEFYRKEKYWLDGPLRV